MKFFQKYVSLLLVLALCCSFLSVGVLADGEAAAEEIVEEAPAPAIELTVEESSQPEPTAGLEEEPPAVIEIVLPTEAPEATEIPVEDVETAAPAETVSPVESEAPEVIEIPVEEPVEEEVITVYRGAGTYVNPLYADVINGGKSESVTWTETVSIALDGSAEGYNTTVESAADEVRQGFVSRTGTIEVQYYAEAFDFNAEWESLALTIFETALAHTGVGTEGDYLRWQYGEVSYSASALPEDANYYIIFTYTVSYYTTAEQEATVTAAIQELLSSFAFEDGTSDYTKIKTIYDYICSNVCYDNANLNDEEYLLKYTAYAALINKTSVCQGYALLFYRLTQEVGIDSRIIGGYGTQGETLEAHSWNIVALDGCYYYLDATWDAGVVTYSYFLKGSSDFPYHENGNMNGIDYSSEGFLSAYVIADTAYAVSGIEDGTYTEGSYTYLVQSGEAIILSYKGNEADVIVPAAFDGCPVVSVASDAFSANDSIKTLTFSEGIKEICGMAVYRCGKLVSVYVPSTVTMLGMSDIDGIGQFWVEECAKLETITVSEDNNTYASCDGVLYTKDMISLLLRPCGNTQKIFEVPDGVQQLTAFSCRNNSYLEKVILPESLLMIHRDVFHQNTALKEINIPENCWYIWQYVFSGTAIESLHLPASVSYLGSGAFSGMTELKEITVDSANPVFYAEDNILFKSGEPYDVLVCYAAQRNGTSYTLPEGVILGWFAFSEAEHLETVELNSTIEQIPYRAFDSCSNLLSIEISENVTLIDDEAFFSCKRLASITIPASVTKIGGCTSAEYGYGEVDRSLVFANVSGMTIVGVAGSAAEEYAEEFGYYFCEIGAEFTRSGSCGDNLTWRFADGILSIEGAGAMYDYGYGEAPWYAYRSSVFELNLQGVTHIGNCAFEWCGNLKSVELPDSITSIGKEAFINCHYIESIEFSDSLELIDSLAFASCHGLTEIEIPAGTIGWNAFTSCAGLKTVTLGDGVTIISDRAFEGCDLLEMVEIPANIISIGARSFDGGVVVDDQNSVYCSDDNGVLYSKDKSVLVMCPIKMEGVFTIPAGVTRIGDNAFEACASITEAVLPDGLKTIGGSAFAYCAGLTDLTFPDSVTGIEWFAFCGCENLAAVSAGVGVTDVAQYAFADCYGLKSVTFSGAEPTIGENCFRDVTAVINYPLIKNWTEDIRQNYGGTLTWAVYEICGDASGDGKVEIFDLVHMVKYILGDEENIYETGADVTGDGEINILDVVRLMRYLAGDNITLG